MCMLANTPQDERRRRLGNENAMGNSTMKVTYRVIVDSSVTASRDAEGRGGGEGGRDVGGQGCELYACVCVCACSPL